MVYTGLVRAGEDYKSELISAIGSSSHRVLLEAMVIDSFGMMSCVIGACIDASIRGVEVVVVYDRYSLFNSILEHGVGGALALNRLTGELQSSGVKLHKVGRYMGFNPFAGRNHAKVVVVDDTIFAGGGVNLTGNSFGAHDYMLKFHDSQLATKLFRRLPVWAVDRPVSESIKVNSEIEVLLDGGVRGESIILDTVKRVASRAEKVYYVSKLAPDDDSLTSILAGKTEYWFNSISSGSGFDKLALFIDGLKAPHIDNSYKGNTVLHAKFIVAKMSDGRLEAVAGSHNFNSRGVRYGTQELVVHAKNQNLCRDLLKFIDSL